MASGGTSRSTTLGSSETLYYVAFGLYIFVYGLSRTNFDEFLFVSADAIVDVGRIACVLLLATKLLIQRYSRKQLFGLFAVGAIALAALYMTKDWNLVLLYFFVAAGRDVSIKQLAYIALPIQIGMLLITVTFAGYGLIESRYLYRSYDGILQLRSSMGYSHPNSFGQSVLSVCCSYAILRFPKFNIADLGIYTFGAAVCYFFADSRTSIACIAFLAILGIACMMLDRRKSLGKMAGIAVVISFCAIAFSLSMMVFYDASVQLMRDLNSMLSARLSLMHTYFQNYPIRPFGYASRTVVLAISANYMQYGPDNAYARMVILDGLLPALVFISFYLATFVHFAKKKRFDSCVFALLIFAVAAVMESYSLSFAANYCLVGMTVLIYGWDQYEAANGQFDSGTAKDASAERKIRGRGNRMRSQQITSERNS